MNPPIPEHDPVEHPKHYCSHPSGIECIEVTRHMNFNCGNVIKYLWRCGLKDSSPSIEDLRKAAWYLNDEIRRVQGDGQPTYEAVALDPTDDFREYLAARKRMRDAMTPAEELPPLEVLHEGGKKVTWGSLFESPLEKASKEASVERPILIADEQAPTNLDALADRIDEVVNEFPTEPLDPHS